MQHLSAALKDVNSYALTHLFGAALCNAGMRTVEEVRRVRLAELRDAYGSLTELNKMLDMSARDSTLSQIINASVGSKTKKPKAMGSALARRLEAACGKPEGWMDFDPDCWPFDGLVPVDRVAGLSPAWLREAAGALNEVLRRADAEDCGKQRPRAA